MSRLLLLIALFLCVPELSLAAFKSSLEESAKEDCFNPNVQKDDIMLPMPCGLQLALRAVAVPVSSQLRDKAFRMGVTNATGDERNFYEKQFDGHLSAPFGAGDLPAAWQKLISDKNLSGDQYYFIGKYEVSRLQWQAVMEAVDDAGEENPRMCGRLNMAGGNLPQGGISWFDAQKFLQKYNAWLIRNHADALPHFANTSNIGFIRLPTEEEWEYAARGVPMVPSEWWEDKDIFPLEKGRELKDYGIFNSGAVRREPAPIGSRNPNPLGIHDVIGNMRELVDGFFRFSIADMKGGSVQRRLHGSAGGILCKGGSYLSEEEAVMPGVRDELPFFTANGETRPADVGMRVVLSSLNIPAASKLENLRAEEAAMPVQDNEPAESWKNPLAAVRQLAGRAEGSLKSSLDKVVSLLEDQQNAEKARYLKSVDRSLHSLLYQAETLRAFALRYVTTKKQIGNIEAMPQNSLDAGTRKKVEQALKEARSDLADYLESLKMGASYYRQELGAVLEAEQQELAQMLSQARREYGGESIFNEHIRQNIDEIEKFIKKAQKDGLSSISSSMILKNTLPPQHLKQLPI